MITNHERVGRIILDAQDIYQHVITLNRQFRTIDLDVNTYLSNVFDCIVDKHVVEAATQYMMEQIAEHHAKDIEGFTEHGKACAEHDLYLLGEFTVHVADRLMKLLDAYRLYNSDNEASFHIVAIPSPGVVIIDAYMDYEISPYPEFKTGITMTAPKMTPYSIDMF